MARDTDSFEQRFPLRRPAEPAPAPAPQAWRPPPVEAEPVPTRAKRPAPPPPPPPPAPAPPPRRRREEPLELTDELPPAGARAPRYAPPPPPPAPPPQQQYYAQPEPRPPAMYTTNLPVVIRKRSWMRWAVRGTAGMIVLFTVAVGWLALTAPLSKSLEPPAPPSITLLSADGTPIARRGASIGPPVDAATLPEHVRGAFVAIEDRRFYNHWGVDPRGTLRALVNNLSSSNRAQGGSTITQQLAKNAFLDSSRTVTRKFQEALIAFWLEAWLSKDEILSRYLSNVYFGDNAYGLSAAARHYFSCKPEELTLSQATMLAGLVQAPSRLAPTGNLKGARERQKLVLASMVSTGLIEEADAARVRPAVLKTDKVRQLPNGGYFADWVLPQARDRAGGVATQQTVSTTLETRAQQAAERAVRGVGLRKAQIAIVAMRPDGRVVAMVGGTNYAQSPFNRATQARRQPGSTFKLFVYLAALRAGMSPDSMVDDTPVTIGNWSPENHDGRYAGRITLRQAFAKSSNVVAARLTRRLGVANVTRAARDLGISTPIGNEASIGLGTSTVSLLELTAAYAAIANGAYPVRPHGLARDEADSDWLASRLGAPTRFPPRVLDEMRSMLGSVVQSGTGRAANLAIPAYGKTGTTQDNRDALFIGYAGGLIAGVWLGNDDNSPNSGLSGSGLPARVWRDFMTRALNIKAAAPPPVEDPLANETIGLEEIFDDLIEGRGVRIGEDGIEIEIDTDPGRERLESGAETGEDEPLDERRERRREELELRPARPGSEGRGVRRRLEEEGPRRIERAPADEN